jgi:taurine---2-oxoglutarate transaminase
MKHRMPNEDFAAIQARYVMQCWSAQRDYAPLPVKATSGCWIHTTDGRKIFDLRSAHECINLGFNHPKVLHAMRRQMESVVYVTDDFATEPTAMLAQTLARLAPGGPDKKVFFSQSGASAVEAAIRAARLYMYNKVIKGGALVDAPMQYPVFAPEANPYRPLFGSGLEATQANLNYLDYVIEQEGGSNKVAAIILEPVVGSNGIIVPPQGYLKGVRELCDKWGILLIADETMTGMGRTAAFSPSSISMWFRTL